MARRARGIYVEIVIKAPMEVLWEHTQRPDLHQRWDLRFSEIVYLPRAAQSMPQRFRYATRIGFGLEVSGEGQTTADRALPDGSASSALTFDSAERISIIREGSGYWKYVPTADGIRFLTWYDYRTRFGLAGVVLDRIIFRPLIGWATAWSFDRLRLWLDERVDPAVAVRQALIHAVARLALATIFFYQGLVPKLIASHADEIVMLGDLGVPPDVRHFASNALGIAEIAFSATLLAAWSRRWPAWLCVAVMAIATATVAVSSPRFFAGAFNPLSLNLAVTCLAAIDLLVLRGVPSAARCRRRPAACPR